QNADKAGDYRCDRAGLSDNEPGPGVEKSGHGAVAVADVDVFSAGLRLHGAEFGVSECTEKREQAAYEPGEIYELRRAYRLHHFRRNKEDTAADDRAHDDGGGLAYPEVAREFGLRGNCSMRYVAHGIEERSIAEGLICLRF